MNKVDQCSRLKCRELSHGIPPLPRSKNIQGKGDLLHFLSQKTHAGTPPPSLDPPHPRTMKQEGINFSRFPPPPPWENCTAKRAPRNRGKVLLFLWGGGDWGIGERFFPSLAGAVAAG